MTLIAFCKDKNLNDLYKKVNSGLAKVSKWFKLNKLSLNIQNTCYNLFKNIRKMLINNLYLAIDDVIIEQVDHTKYFGCYKFNAYLGGQY